MILVVADTSPIRYLVVIGQIDLLRKLYVEVILPETVLAELLHPLAPGAVRAWGSAVPSWVRVSRQKQEIKEVIEQLDPGEAAAIALAKEIGADLLLLDDREAREVALSHGIAVTGTIGILEAAATAGLIDLATELTKLTSTNFRIAPGLLEKILSKRSKRG